MTPSTPAAAAPPLPPVPRRRLWSYLTYGAYGRAAVGMLLGLLLGGAVVEQTGEPLWRTAGGIAGFLLGFYGIIHRFRNRIHRIAALPEPPGGEGPARRFFDQDAKYRRLREVIGFGLAPRLHPGEVEALCEELEALRQRRDATYLETGRTYLLWELVGTAPANPHAHAVAHRYLEDAGASYRGLALGYLSRRFPGEAGWLFERYQNDRDGDVLFSLGCSIRRKDRTRAVDLWIDGYACRRFLIPEEDYVWFIVHSGTEANLARLRELEKTRPYYQALREGLERELTRRR